MLIAFIKKEILLEGQSLKASEACQARSEGFCVSVSDLIFTAEKGGRRIEEIRR